ncbi:unnamed protein product [Ixodes pacificus]
MLQERRIAPSMFAHSILAPTSWAPCSDKLTSKLARERSARSRQQ